MSFDAASDTLIFCSSVFCGYVTPNYLSCWFTMSVLLWCDINVWVNIVACDPMAMISNPADAKWQIKVLFTPSYCEGNNDKRGWVMTFWVWKIQNLCCLTLFDSWTVFYQSSLDHLSSQTMLTKGSGEEVRALHRLSWSCSRKLFLRQYKKSKGLKLETLQ